MCDLKRVHHNKQIYVSNKKAIWTMMVMMILKRTTATTRITFWWKRFVENKHWLRSPINILLLRNPNVHFCYHKPLSMYPLCNYFNKTPQPYTFFLEHSFYCHPHINSYITHMVSSLEVFELKYKPDSIYMTRPSYPHWFNHPNIFSW
jgi:hypothetical protein